MSEIERIGDQLQRAFEGNAWHGPAVREVLAGLTATHAAAWTIPGAHSIWENVLHVIAWKRVVRRRLEGELIGGIGTEEDWPTIRDESEPSWKAALAELEKEYRALSELISSLTEAKLFEIVPGTSYSFYFMLHGVIQHDLYHAGQISLLRRAMGP